MMPAKPHRFDARPALARLQTDRTDTYRELQPDLRAVWDELDELREEKDARFDRRGGLLDVVENRLKALMTTVQNMVDGKTSEDLPEIVTELDELLTTVEDGRAET